MIGWSTGFLTWMATGGLVSAVELGGQDPSSLDEFRRRSFEILTQDVPEVPIAVVLSDGTCGRIELEWNEKALPLLASEAGVFVAATTLGQGRAVGFGGQDFLGSDEGSFVGRPGNDTLIRNAVTWASGKDRATARVLVDNEAVAKLLTEAGHEVQIARIRSGTGPHAPRVWSNEALKGFDVAVVQVNEWDETRVDEAAIAPLRAFVENGGGLLIGGSSYHWHGDDPRLFPANLILTGSGLSWDGEEEPDLTTAKIPSRAPLTADALWRAYVEREPVLPWERVRLADLIASKASQGGGEELEIALERMWDETPPLPVAAKDPSARLSANVAVALGPRAWPAPHPWAEVFPGWPSDSAKRVDRTVEVDLAWTGARPLGLYAPPGELVSIDVPEAWAGRGFSLVIGDSHDDLRVLRDHTSWRRAPKLDHAFVVDSQRVEASNPFGGPIYLINPEQRNAQLSLSVRGAIPMGVYTLGETKPEDWERDLAQGAPQAIVQVLGRIRMVVSTSEARRLEDPARPLTFWSGFHASHAELAQEPVERTFESHFIFDPQVGSGYANATAVAWSETGFLHHIPRIVFPLDATKSLLQAQNVDEYWTVGHELGHQFQTDDWIGGDLTEVAVNLFPLYTTNRYVHGGSDFETLGFEEDHVADDDLVNFRWDDVGEWEKLHMYRQLVRSFGWGAMKETFRSYYDSDRSRAEYGGHTDGFAIRFSRIVERDLTSFLGHWEYPLSLEAAAKIRSFGYEPWMPPGWSTDTQEDLR